VNDNQKLKEIIKTIESDYQIEFGEMDWHGEGIFEYVIFVKAENNCQIRICINLISGAIEGNDLGECHITCDFLSDFLMLDDLYAEFTAILQACNAPVLRAKKLRNLVG
jgi:hypothetical protein